MHVPWQRRHPRSSEWQCRSGWWSSGPSQFQCPPATATIIQQVSLHDTAKKDDLLCCGLNKPILGSMSQIHMVIVCHMATDQKPCTLLFTSSYSWDLKIFIPLQISYQVGCSIYSNNPKFITPIFSP